MKWFKKLFSNKYKELYCKHDFKHLEIVNRHWTMSWIMKPTVGFDSVYECTKCKEIKIEKGFIYPRDIENVVHRNFYDEDFKPRWDLLPLAKLN